MRRQIEEAIMETTAALTGISSHCHIGPWWLGPLFLAALLTGLWVANRRSR